MRRLSAAGLVALAGELSERDRAMTETVARLRLVSCKQLEVLFFAEVARTSSRARLARRACARLVEHGVLGRLERRVGGVRAGAAGHVYYAAPAGLRLVAYWQGEGLRRPRARYEPTRAFVRHAIGVSDLYVRLVVADREDDALKLLAFESEPAQVFVGPGGARSVLRPDAFARLGVGADHASELHAFLELDLGSEGRQVLARKCRAYIAAWRSGIAPVFPMTIWVATTERRAEVLREVCASMPPETWKLFAVTTPERLIDLLAGIGMGAS